MPSTPDERQLRLREVDWRTIDDETIILDLATERYLRLNGTGTLLWDRLAAGATRGALVAALIESFRIDEAVAGRDVDAFLADLRLQGLLDEASAA